MRRILFLVLPVLAGISTSFAVAGAAPPQEVASAVLLAQAGPPAPAVAPVPSPTAPALIPSPAPPPADPLNLAAELLKAFKMRDWSLLAGFALLLLVYALRKWVFGSVAWFKTDEGGVVFTFAISLASVLGAALSAGQTFTWSLLSTATMLAFAAMGSYAGLKKFALPLARKAAARWKLVWLDSLCDLFSGPETHAVLGAPTPASAAAILPRGFASRQLLWVLTMAVGLGMVAWGLRTPARAADTNSPGAKITCVTLGAATAKLMPVDVPGRQAVAVQNRDAAAIYCGFTSAVSATVGSWQIAASGGGWSVPLSYVQAGKGDVWCYSTAGTAAAAVCIAEAR